MTVPSEPLPLGVLVSGRGSNLQAIIDLIEAGQLPTRLALTVSDRERAPALDRARRHGAPALFLDPKGYADRAAWDWALGQALEAHRVELVCLAGFMRILGPELIRSLAGRIMNVHPSLLPAFPGLHAQRQALDHGVRIAGATVHFVDEGVDTGPIILQEAVPVLAADTEETLSARIRAVEHRLYPRAIRLYAEGRLRLAGRRVLIAEETEPPRS